MSELNDFVTAQDGKRFGVYVANPTEPNGHAIVLLQEIFGVTKTIRKVADNFAADGYLVYAPDLFWRFEPGMELSHSKEDIKRAMSLLEQYDLSDGVEDVSQTLDHIRQLPGFNGKIAAIGLCMGGHLAYRCAVQTNVDAAVSYYGIGIDESIESVGLPKCPTMLHYGVKDSFLTPEALETVQKRLGSLPNVSIHLYEDADHGFYTRGSENDIRTAHERTEAFLQKAFGSASA